MNEPNRTNVLSVIPNDGIKCEDDIMVKAYLNKNT